MDSGFIKLYRQILDWEWYDDINTTRLYLHLLLTVNWKKNKWRGIDILPGQIVTGREKLSVQTGLSVQQIRTSLKRLQSTNEITIKATKQYTIITVNNYERYQGVNQQSTSDSTNDLTNEQPTSNQQITTIEELKNLRTKEIKKQDNSANSLFDHLWSLYPNKKGKGQVSDKDKRTMLVIGIEEMERAIRRYLADLEQDDWRKPQNGSTFFHSGYIDYLDENYQPLSTEESVLPELSEIDIDAIRSSDTSVSAEEIKNKSLEELFS